VPTHHHHPGRRPLALGLLICALACAAVTEASAATRTVARPSAVQIVRVSSHNFDWGDAGIGAAAGIGISMLAVGAALLISGARHNQAPPPPRLTAKQPT
jgi:uncharacterized membrane protein